MITAKKSLICIVSFLFIFLPKVASAHCPLCTAGAGALAVLAAYLGVSTIVVGLFIGAFSLALGIWLSRSIQKKYIKYQDATLSLVIYISTIVPIMPLIREYRPLYVSIFGKYGTLLHNTYSINLYLTGAVLGAVLLYVSPYLSRYFTKVSGKKIPFQSMIVTFSLLAILGIILQISVG